MFFVRTKIRRMKDDKNKVGRPIKEVKASARCEFRVLPKKKAEYKIEAKKHGLSLGAWLQSLADKAIE